MKMGVGYDGFFHNMGLYKVKGIVYLHIK